jgi:hypothetical protein
MNTKEIGSLTEVIVMTALMKAGYKISVPWGDNSPYDLIADKNNKLMRIQCKTGKIRNGSIEFSTSRVSYCAESKKPVRQKYEEDSFDAFAVFCEETESAYLVPRSEVGTSQGYLRINEEIHPNANSEWHLSRMTWAKDYIL